MRIVGSTDLREQPGLRLIQVDKSLPCGLRSEIILFSYWTSENTENGGRDVLSSHMIDQKVVRLFSELNSLVCCWGFEHWIYSPDTQALESEMVKESKYRHVCATESPFLKCQNSCDKVLKMFD